MTERYFIRIDNPEQSKAIQEILFERLNTGWLLSGKNIVHTDMPTIFIDCKNTLTFGSCMEYFIGGCIELSAPEIIKGERHPLDCIAHSVCVEEISNPCDHDCIHCDDEACAGDEPRKLRIPLREQIYGRDTHAALMAAHLEREQASKWTGGRTRKALADTGTGNVIAGLVRSMVGDVRTDEGEEEK